MNINNPIASRNQTEIEAVTGVWCPPITALNAQKQIEKQLCLGHINWLFENGCKGIALFGTTSEANSFSVDERIELLEYLLEHGIAAENIMVGTGCCSMTDTLSLTRHAVNSGCYRVLMLPPFYYKSPSIDGLFNAFAHTIEQVNDDRLRVYLYHFPKMSTVPIPIPLIAHLKSSFGSCIAGLKDSSGELDYTRSVIEAFDDMAVFPGTELLLKEGLELGSAGVISATVNIQAGILSKVFNHWQQHGICDGQQYQTAIEIRKTLQTYPMIGALKTIKQLLSDDERWNNVRPPLTTLDSNQQQKLIGELTKLGFV